MLSQLKTIEHAIAGQHIREYPNALRHRQEDELQIAVKQYVPKSQAEPLPANAVTIIGVPAIGFPKETYEPLWEEMYNVLRAKAIPVRGFWMADSSAQGASGVLNENIQGDDVNWFDHSRDLLLMVNHFRREMPRPIMGVAHSMGCAQLVRLSIMHPRLLTGIILHEPIILSARSGTQGGMHPSFISTIRRDIWPTRGEAEKSLRKGLRTLDPRVLALYLKHGLRDVPTAVYKPGDALPVSTSSKPKAGSKQAEQSSQVAVVPSTAVTLTTTKAHEAWAYARLNMDPPDPTLDRLFRPDWDRKIELQRRSSRSECLWAMRELPHVRPRLLFVFGSKSPFSTKLDQDEKLEVAGTSWGGSGGVKAGMVSKEVFEEGGHLFPLEQVSEAASRGAEWMAQTLRAWEADEEVIRTHDSRKSENTVRLSKDWIETVKMDANAPRPRKEKL